MPGITERSTKEPVLKVKQLNHGTLGCTDLAKTRRFYEEVLGLDVVQGSPVSMMVRRGNDFTYAVVETPAHTGGMGLLGHNGFEVETFEEVEEAHAAIMAVKDEWGLKVMPTRTVHGSHTFYFEDFDGNWWEVVSAGKGGYIEAFHDESFDITGRHELDDWTEHFIKTKELKHTQEPKDRAEVIERCGL
ncbi:VOC family protein [Actibacterium sp. D379-3]